MLRNSILTLTASLMLLAGIWQVQAGAVGGPKQTVDRIDAYSTKSYAAMFRAGEQAVIILVGDGDTDLDLYVYDENGNLIAEDEDSTDRCVVTFRPRWTGWFTIKVVNRGCVFNEFVMRSN